MPLPTHKVPTEGEWKILLKTSKILCAIICFCFVMGFFLASPFMKGSKLFRQRNRNGSLPISSIVLLTLGGFWAVIYLFAGLFICLGWTIYLIKQWRLKRDYDLEPDSKTKELKRKVLIYKDSSSYKLPV